jgi:hypothetical protein
MIDTKKYQAAQQNMKFVTPSLCSLANIFWLNRLIFSVSINSCIFDKIKTKFQELECEWTGQTEEYTKKNSPPK